MRSRLLVAIGLFSVGMLVAASAAAQEGGSSPSAPPPPTAPAGYRPYPTYVTYADPPENDEGEEAARQRKKELEERMRIQSPGLLAGGIAVTTIGGGGAAAGLVLALRNIGWYGAGRDEAEQRGGLALLVGGAALVAIGVPMIVVGRRRVLGPAPPPSEGKTVWISAGPRGGALGGRF